MNKAVNSSNIFNTTSRRAALSFGTLKIIAALFDASLILMSSGLGFLSYNFCLTSSLQITTDSFSAGTIAAALFIIIAYLRGCYQIDALVNPALRVKSIWVGVGISILLLVSFIFILKVGTEYSRGSIVVFSAFALGSVPLGRLMLARVTAYGMENGLLVGRRGLVIGAASELEKILPYDLRLLGIEEVARVAVVRNDEGAKLGEKGRTQINHAINLARDLRVIEFVLVIPWAQEVLLAEVCDLLHASPLSVKLLPDSTTRRIFERQGNGGFGASLVVEIQREPLDAWERLVKRSIDLGLAIAAAVVLAPILIVTAVAIKLDSHGPVLFRQRRVGFDNKEFLIYKFRTMTAMDDGVAIVQACRKDPRVTRVGKFLRRSSIDELPQIFNIVRGDMSIVGPRPHAVAHHDQYSALIASYALRHHMKPGLTGMAQIRGLRGATPQLALMERRVEQDLWYISHWSLRLDLIIIVQTCFALLRDYAY
jgi:Undecaprenyl-phosphate glucose phosphotransferase